MSNFFKKFSDRQLQILSIFGFFAFISILLIFIFLKSNYFTIAATSPDAIAIRVIPNPYHYSPFHWYQNQGFTGSPQSLIVDGYEAVRDGRTVYVNAANVDTAGNNLYTNLYLISYNQDAENATQDILGRILEHWKFNTNVSGAGACSSAISTACLLSNDCPSGEYCSSPKAKIVRDTARLSRLVEIRLALEDYKNKNSFYPTLESGTYLTNKTISVWPSWQDTLSKELGFSMPVDPINRLGSCSGYDTTTCWDEKTKKFAGSIPDNLPTGSNVIVYNSQDNGLDYDICAVMESGYVTDLTNGACPQSYVNLSGKPGANNKPVIVKANIPKAYTGYPFCCFIEVYDPDNDKLVWTIDTTPGNPWTGWSNPPTLGDSGVPSQRAISAASVGDPGAYQFTITVDDGRGGVVTQTYTIDVSSSGPPNITFVPPPVSAVIGKNITPFTITAMDPDSQYPLSFSLTGLPKGLTGALINKHDYSISGAPVDQTISYTVNVSAADSGGQSSAPQSFQITVTNNPPVVTSAPVTNAYLCAAYEYQVTASDPDGHALSYSAAGLPAGLSIDPTTGLISGQPTAGGNFTATVTAKDQYASQTVAPYSAQANQNYTLTVGNEVFSINPIKNSSIFVFPASVKMTSLYRSPVTYFGKATVTTAGSVTYSLSNNPGWLVIDPAKGYIQGTPTNNTTDPGVYTITVNAVNKCGTSQSTTFTLTVYKNEWCGDGAQQPSFNEACDDGNNIDTDECSNSCKAKKTFCGDGAVQTPNSYGFNEQCEAPGTGTSNSDQYDCANCAWAGGWCGDSIIQTSFNEQCDNGANNGIACVPAYNSSCSYCSAICKNITVLGGTCGDGIKNGPEQCDDGNIQDGDGCDKNCQINLCYLEPAGMIGWWPGDGNANDYKDANNGALNGATYTAGEVAQAFNFNGINNYVNIPETGSNLDGFNELTINAWIKANTQTWTSCDSPTPSGQIVSKYNSNSGGISYLLGVISIQGVGNELMFYAGGAYIVSQDTIPAGWINVAGIWRGGNNIELYINGNKINGTVSGSNPVVLPNTSVPVNIGRIESFSGCYVGPGAYFNGQIDEVQIYNKALSATEIKSIYDSGSFGMCK